MWPAFEHQAIDRGDQFVEQHRRLASIVELDEARAAQQGAGVVVEQVEVRVRRRRDRQVREESLDRFTQMGCVRRHREGEILRSEASRDVTMHPLDGTDRFGSADESGLQELAPELVVAHHVLGVEDQ